MAVVEMYRNRIEELFKLGWARNATPKILLLLLLMIGEGENI